MSANGGRGIGSGGGGAGGRMSIYCVNMKKMNISLSAHGGKHIKITFKFLA